MTTTNPCIWIYGDSVEFEDDGRTIQGQIRFMAEIPDHYEVVDSGGVVHEIHGDRLRQGPVALVQLLTGCDADPPHPRMWIEGERTDHPITCLYCAYDVVSEAHSGCGHSHHGRWRRWRITHRVLGWLYRLGVVSGYGAVFNAHCSGCLTRVRFRGKRVYILGVPRGQWRCLLRGHHWPGEQLAWDMCGKCCPCPECGSTTWAHKAGCGEDLSAPGGAS